MFVHLAQKRAGEHSSRGATCRNGGPRLHVRPRQRLARSVALQDHLLWQNALNAYAGRELCAG
ncbi:MAG: hypothetical protein ABI300_09660, partial [Rhodanobacter sp.]